MRYLLGPKFISVDIPDDDALEGENLWDNTLIGYCLGKRQYYVHLQAWPPPPRQSCLMPQCPP